MFKIFKQVARLEKTEGFQDQEIEILMVKVRALEEYLNIEFFNGASQKPHYRKLRVVKKKLGRPKKVTK